ncbi:MAG: hypothetical protein HQL68_13045 [Magnetococcales bacterium]|nr:hypothetical protein [Magnetococcales bacterium]
MKHSSVHYCFILLLVLFFTFLQNIDYSNAAGAKTIIASAEGLADPEADIYKRDKAMMIDYLRRDAKRQIIEKVVGTFVDSSTMVESGKLISDKVMTKSKGLIKRIVKESPPWLGDDGFMHILMKAEVYLANIESVLNQISKSERINLIKEHGNPTISVAIIIKDAQRVGQVQPERSKVAESILYARRSTIAENIVKERMSKFGYRIWSSHPLSTISVQQIAQGGKSREANKNENIADFTIIGETKFKTISMKLSSSGLKITKYILTSWTVKCLDNSTGEEIYFNNKIPRNKTWTEEEYAIKDIGSLISSEFSRSFFKNHLMKPSRILQLQISGLPSYDVGVLFKKEMLGLRSVLNINFKNFKENGVSLYEVEFSGSQENAVSLINNTVIKPINRKLGEGAFKLSSFSGNSVKIKFHSNKNLEKLKAKFKRMPPSSLAFASPARLFEVVKSKEARKKVAKINPEGLKKMDGKTSKSQPSSIDAVQDF